MGHWFLGKSKASTLYQTISCGRKTRAAFWSLHRVCTAFTLVSTQGKSQQCSCLWTEIQSSLQWTLHPMWSTTPQGRWKTSTSTVTQLVTLLDSACLISFSSQPEQDWVNFHPFSSFFSGFTYSGDVGSEGFFSLKRLWEFKILSKEINIHDKINQLGLSKSTNIITIS